MAGQVVAALSTTSLPHRHSGMVRQHQTRNLEIPGSMRCIAPERRSEGTRTLTGLPQMNHDAYDDNYIRAILNGVKSIAMVGASPVNMRPSYLAFKYLAQRGYDMIPVNPGHIGKSLLGKPFVASLLDIGRPVDMIDIFRNSSHIGPVVDEALKMTPPPKVIWMQLGARDDAAAAKAEAAGLKVVMNRCPKIEYGRLSSEISWMGVNSRTLSSKRAPMPTQGMRLSLNRMSVGGGETTASDRAAKNKNDLA